MRLPDHAGALDRPIASAPDALDRRSHHDDARVHRPGIIPKSIAAWDPLGHASGRRFECEIDMRRDRHREARTGGSGRASSDSAPLMVVRHIDPSRAPWASQGRPARPFTETVTAGTRRLGPVAGGGRRAVVVLRAVR
jgi:hypothetical protein